MPPQFQDPTQEPLPEELDPSSLRDQFGPPQDLPPELPPQAPPVQQPQVQRKPVQPKRDHFKNLLGDFLFSLGRGLEASSKAPQGGEIAAGMGAGLQGQEELRHRRAQEEQRQMALEDDLARKRLYDEQAAGYQAREQSLAEDRLARQRVAEGGLKVREQEADTREKVGEATATKARFLSRPEGIYELPTEKGGKPTLVPDTASKEKITLTQEMSDKLGLPDRFVGKKYDTGELNNLTNSFGKNFRIVTGKTGVWAYNLATQEKTKIDDPRPSGSGPMLSIEELTPAQHALLEAAADRVMTGELTPYQANTLLGGTRGGLSVHLMQKLVDEGSKIIPTKLRENVTDFKRAIPIIDKIEELVEETIKSPGFMARVENSAMLEGLLKATGTTLSRGIGSERGVVTNQDREAAIGWFPGWKSANFAPEFARKKLKLVRDLVDKQLKAWTTGYFEKLPRPESKGPSGAKPGDEWFPPVPGTFKGKRMMARQNKRTKEWEVLGAAP
jgi:hypothetical protein